MKGVRSTWPVDIQALLPDTALYVGYLDYLSKLAWRLAGRRKAAILPSITIGHVPPPIAALLLTHLEEMYGINILTDQESVNHKTTNHVQLVDPRFISRLCAFELYDKRAGRGSIRIGKPNGDIVFVSGCTIEWNEWTAVRGDSNLVFTLATWCVTASHADVIPAEDDGSTDADWISNVKQAKSTLREWIESENNVGAGAPWLSPQLRRCGRMSRQCTVAPVTRSV